MGLICQASAADAPSVESTAEDLDGREYSCGVIAFFWATWITWIWTWTWTEREEKDGKVIGHWYNAWLGILEMK